MSEQDRREGGREGMGILSALREALDEVMAEGKGGMSADRAREAVRGAMAKAREAAGEARERLDFATEQDVRDLREALGEFKVRLENLERRIAQDPSAGASRPQSEGPEGSGTGPVGL